MCFASNETAICLHRGFTSGIRDCACNLIPRKREMCFVFDIAWSYMQKAHPEHHCLKSVLVYAIGTYAEKPAKTSLYAMLMTVCLMLF